MTDSNSRSLYEIIGGAETVRRIVDAFYPKVQASKDLGPLFPENIDPVRERQYQFLTQFFGGPLLYTEEHGHPMMRGRHMHFPLTPKLAEAWLGCMRETLEDIGMDPVLRQVVLERLKAPAQHFINSPGE
jgi:hemoglobin